MRRRWTGCWDATRGVAARWSSASRCDCAWASWTCGAVRRLAAPCGPLPGFARFGGPGARAFLAQVSCPGEVAGGGRRPRALELRRAGRGGRAGRGVAGRVSGAPGDRIGPGRVAERGGHRRDAGHRAGRSGLRTAGSGTTGGATASPGGRLPGGSERGVAHCRWPGRWGLEVIADRGRGRGWSRRPVPAVAVRGGYAGLCAAHLGQHRCAEGGDPDTWRRTEPGGALRGGRGHWRGRPAEPGLEPGLRRGGAGRVRCAAERGLAAPGGPARGGQRCGGCRCAGSRPGSRYSMRRRRCIAMCSATS